MHVCLTIAKKKKNILQIRRNELAQQTFEDKRMDGKKINRPSFKYKKGTRVQ
jgi:hypothetical protein